MYGHTSQSSNIILDASHNINLDFKGDTLSLASGKSLTLTAGNQITTASTGTITTSNGAINLNATNGILLNNAFTFNSGGGGINFNNALTLGADATVDFGGGAVTFASAIKGATYLTTNGRNASATAIIIPPTVRAVINQNSPALDPAPDEPAVDDTDSVNLLSALSPTADCSDVSQADGLTESRRCRAAAN